MLRSLQSGESNILIGWEQTTTSPWYARGRTTTPIHAPYRLSRRIEEEFGETLESRGGDTKERPGNTQSPSHPLGGASGTPCPSGSNRKVGPKRTKNNAQRRRDQCSIPRVCGNPIVGIYSIR